MTKDKKKETTDEKIREANRLKQRLFRARDKEQNIARMYLRMPEPIMEWARGQAAQERITISEFVLNILQKVMDDHMYLADHEKSCIEKLGSAFPHVHKWFDQFFIHYRTYAHRAILHHRFGIETCVKEFGEEARAAAELHVLDDSHGRIPADPLEYINDPAFYGSRRELVRLSQDIKRMLGIDVDMDGD